MIKKQNIKTKNKLNRTRVLVLGLFFGCFSLYVLYTLFSVSVLRGEDLKKEALAQWTKSYKVKNSRGEIFDRDGVKLAVNIPAYNVWLNPKEYNGSNASSNVVGGNENKEQFIQKVSEIFNVDSDEILDILSKDKRRKIVQWADKETIDKLEEVGEFDWKGLEVEEVQRRFYPDGTLYSHILGFTNIDQIGLSGVEFSMNESLIGKPETVIKMTDSYNKVLPFSQEKTFGGSGYGDVVLTVSDKIQRIADKEAKKALEENNAKSVSVIVMNPTNGDILAMSDTNIYDNNNPREPKDEAQREEWKDKTDEEMVAEWQKNWNNLNVNVLYEPGSTFKTVTLAAAIEEGAADDSTELFCNGMVTDIPGVVLRCVRWQNPHGRLNITSAYAESCNVAFIQIARLLGKEKFLKYIQAFGFGEKSGIYLNGEQSGIVPQTINDMTPVTLATASYGQGVAVTNLQTVMATAAAVNGGYLLRPRIVKQIKNGEEIIKSFPVEIRRKVISKLTSDKMREIMEVAVNQGNKLARVEGYRIGGKSGTAMIPENGKYLENKYVASFVGVAPIEDPKVLTLVSVEEPGNGIPYGGTIAGPVFSKIMSQILPLMGINPETQVQDKETAQKIVPDVIGLTLKEGAEKLGEVGIRFHIEETDVMENSIIEKIEPDVGTVIVDNRIVKLNVRNLKPEEEVPNFMGLTIEEAKDLAMKRNLTVHISGEGVCILQSVEAGSEIKEGMAIDLNFAED
ncbi:MAG: PASTA domain-containing protein [Ezakiella sp.]|nr:PASTA domain-containing protein [Ezakiella sp.]MDD7472062.1 penicillin-binding transpeptidase domain-containing protein [Bacillota bacterium]MDY3924026.1 penicillin-binding transpeptidase domain-containing protein [Ezakiella sp.]